MHWLQSTENFVRRHIEGFFNRKLSSAVHPVEIARQLTRLMENERSVGVSHVYAPNQYNVYLAAEDFDRFAAYKQTIEAELVDYIKRYAAKNDYTIIGHPQVALCKEVTVKPGQLLVHADFLETEEAFAPEEDAADTKIFSKFPAIHSEPLICLEGMLTVVEGLDAGKHVPITVHRINIGRREANELPLTDMNTSRLHSYIVYEDGGHVLYDAKSLNGTYLNEHRITRRHLQNGDRIKVGSSVLLYEVK